MAGERGHTVLLATILGIVAFSAWALAFLTTRDLIRTEKIITLRAERDEGVSHALARGIYLMRTGFPPSEPYACVYTVAGEATDYDCTLTFEREPGEDRWTVTAERSTEEELGMLPVAPERFTPLYDTGDEDTGGGGSDGDAGGDTGTEEDAPTEDPEITALREKIAELEAALEGDLNRGQRRKLQRKLEKAKDELEDLLDD
ncbi:MAG: hypothetical protein QNJ90_12660 [Planctomycetota bacterium]|nr:hypothetical protein [Planctomycetota bacterium]